MLAAAFAATNTIGTAAEDIEMVIGGSSVRDMGAEAAIAACSLLSVCCLCAFAGRFRDMLRHWTPSRRLSISTIRAVHGSVRLMRFGCRTEHRGRAIPKTGAGR